MKLSYNFKIKTLQLNIPLKLKLKPINKLLNRYILKPQKDNINLKRPSVQKYNDQILMEG